MADWLYERHAQPDLSPVEAQDERARDPRTPRRRMVGLGAVPYLQVLCIAIAVAVLVLAPPLFGAVAWIFGAIAVPALWALFFVGFKQRSVGAELWGQERRKKRLNHALLLVGLAVGMVGAFVFATEVAK